MQTIYYVDALAGAGKTHSAIQHAVWLAALGRKVAIVQPSKHLIGESYRKALDMALKTGRFIPITRIDSDTNPGNVTGALAKHLRFTNPQEGEILFATHSAFLNCPYWHNRDLWAVIIDEIISPIEDKSLKLPRNHAKLTGILDLASYNAHYSVLKVREDQDSLEAFAALAENDGDDIVDAVFEDVSHALLSTHWTLFTQTPNWCAIRDGVNAKDQLLIYGLLNPRYFDGFAEVTIMGAMFHDSVLAKVWQDEVQFVEHKAIQSSLRYTTHGAGGLLTIEYLFDRNWSKSFRNSSIRGQKVFDLALERSAAAMGAKDYIFVTNRDAEEYSRKMLATGVRVSNVCHGINEYQHIDNAVFLSALNPAPSQFKLLQNLDVSADELSDAGYHQTVYQAIMRTSLRDPDNKQEKHIIVPDKRAADYLAKYFPGCTVVRNKHLPVITQADVSQGGRPKAWVSDEQRNDARAKRGRVEREQAALIKLAVTPQFSVVESITSSEFDVVDYTNNRQLIDFLAEASQRIVLDKKANRLMSPAIFNASKSSETKRGLDNIEHVNGLWLDNDGGDLTWQEFRAIFPTLHMVAFNTFSGGNRYRVLIPTTTAMTIEVDHIIKRVIFDELADRGFAAPGKETERMAKTHGFDIGKLTPSSLFFMPCQSANPEDSFFVELPGEELNPGEWAKRAPLTMYREEVVVVPVQKAPTKMDAIRSLLAAQKSGPVDREARIEEAQTAYQAIPAGSGTRNNEFYKLGCRLQDLGMDLGMIEQTLRSNANDNDRKAQVKSVISSLRKRPAKTS
jgi:hypothetical protein